MKFFIRNFISGSFLLFAFFAANANAELFSPKNYESCLADGKVGRTGIEIGILKNKCRHEFPALRQLYATNKSTITCLISGSSEVLEFKINGRSVRVGNANAEFILRTTDKYVLKAFHAYEAGDSKRTPLDVTFTIYMTEGAVHKQLSGEGIPSYQYSLERGDCSENQLIPPR